MLKMLKTLKNIILVPRGCFQAFLDTLKLIQNFTKFSKFFSNNVPNISQGLSRTSKNAQQFEKYPLGVKRIFSTISGTLELVSNLTKFFEILQEMTLPTFPKALFGFLKMLKTLKNTL